MVFPTRKVSKTNLGQSNRARPKPGDLIYVERTFHTHFGVYVGRGQVVHYTSNLPLISAWSSGDGKIRKTHLKKFLSGQRTYHVLDFGFLSSILNPSYFNKQLTQIRRNILRIKKNILKLIKRKRILIASREKTIFRALSRIGETDYKLFGNNCEHFAFWCKLGVKVSFQVNSLLDFFGNKIDSVRGEHDLIYAEIRARE